MKWRNKSRPAFALIGMLLGGAVNAATVTLVTDGANNITTPDFWTVSYSPGSDALAVTSISIDLSPLTGVAFDFDGDISFGCNQTIDPTLCITNGVFDPSLDPGAVLSGGTITPTFSWTGTNPTLLAADTAGMGNVGDFFSFGADTDGSAGSGDLMAGAIFTVNFSDGSSAFASLANTCGAQCSVASVSTTVVPVPAAVWLFGSGLLGLAGIARRRR